MNIKEEQCQPSVNTWWQKKEPITWRNNYKTAITMINNRRRKRRNFQSVVLFVIFRWRLQIVVNDDDNCVWKSDSKTDWTEAIWMHSTSWTQSKKLKI